MNEFEQRLGRQRMKEIPREWREEILANAGQELRGEDRTRAQFWPSSLISRFSAMLWPSPAAWGGLAVVWVLILAIDFSVRDKIPVLAEKSTPPSPEMIVELRQQRRLLAELIGPRDISAADRSKSLAPRPRSECVESLAT